jgi:predicted nucleic-acid-binding protein
MGWKEVNITVDTNILVRSAVRDDEKQAKIADRLLADAEIVAVSLPCLCEFVWVLRQVYGFRDRDIVGALDLLLDAQNVIVNRSAVDAGLSVLRAGGDLADGVIAHEGEWLGAETFLSFDKKAVSLLRSQGRSAALAA